MGTDKSMYTSRIQRNTLKSSTHILLHHENIGLNIYYYRAAEIQTVKFGGICTVVNTEGILCFCMKHLVPNFDGKQPKPL